MFEKIRGLFRASEPSETKSWEERYRGKNQKRRLATIIDMTPKEEVFTDQEKTI